MKATIKQPPSLSSESFVGTVHRFGKYGVLYEVLNQANDTLVMIRILDTGEETLYPIADVLNDPTE